MCTEQLQKNLKKSLVDDGIVIMLNIVKVNFVYKTRRKFQDSAFVITGSCS